MSDDRETLRRALGWLDADYGLSECEAPDGFRCEHQWCVHLRAIRSAARSHLAHLDAQAGGEGVSEEDERILHAISCLGNGELISLDAVVPDPETGVLGEVELCEMSAGHLRALLGPQPARVAASAWRALDAMGIEYRGDETGMRKHEEVAQAMAHWRACERHYGIKLADEPAGGGE